MNAQNQTKQLNDMELEARMLELQNEIDAEEASKPKPAIGARFRGYHVVEDKGRVAGPFSPGEAWLDLKIRILASNFVRPDDIGYAASRENSLSGPFLVYLDSLAIGWGWKPETVVEFIGFLRATNQIYAVGNRAALAFTLLRPNDPTWMRQ